MLAISSSYNKFNLFVFIYALDRETYFIFNIQGTNCNFLLDFKSQQSKTFPDRFWTSLQHREYPAVRTSDT